MLFFKRRDVYLVFSYPVPEAALLDAEQLCRPYLFALGPHEGPDNHPLFKPLQLIVDRDAFRLFGGGRDAAAIRYIRRQVCRFDNTRFGNQRGPLYRALKLPHIAGPRVLLELFHGFR